MKLRNLLLLALVVVAMGLFIFFVERDIPSTDVREQMAGKVLRFERGDVRRLSWSWGGRSVALVRESQGEASEESDEGLEPAGRESWLQVEPFRSRVDPDLIGELLSSLESWTLESRIEGADRGQVGLESPRGELVVETDRGPMVVSFGAALPVGQATVVEVEGNEPVVASDAIWGQITRNPGDWRSQQILQVSRDEIREISFEAGGVGVRLASRGTSFWLEEPISDLADEDLLRPLLGLLEALRVESFVDDETVLASAGLAPALARLEVQLYGAEEPRVIELGDHVAGSPGQIYAREGHQAFTISSDLLEAARRPALDWRSRALTELDRWQLESIEIDGALGGLRAERSGSEWLRDGVSIEPAAVEAILDWLTETRAEDVFDGPNPEAPPTIECRLFDREAGVTTLSLFGPEPGALACSGDRPALLRLPAGALTELTEILALLRDAEPRPSEGDSESP